MASQVLLTARVTPTSGGCADSTILSCTAGGALHVLTVGTSLSGSLSQNIVFLGGNAITTGAGVVAAGTLRATLASNDPAVTALQIIDNFIGTDGGAAPTGVGVIGGLDSGGNIQSLSAGTDGVLAANISQLAGYTVNLGAGNVSTGTIRATIASDDLNILKITNAVEIMDDWDESDRCKVNLIAGQAGIAGGAGAVGATVPRFTLASDDPAVASLGVLDGVVGTNGIAVPAGVAVVQIGGSDGTNLRTFKTSSAGALFTEQSTLPAGSDATNDWSEVDIKSHESATLADNSAATVDGTDEAGSDIILPSTYVGNYANWTAWVKNTGATALTHVYVYASKDGTLWTNVDSLKSTLETACDTLAGSNVQGICFTCSMNPGWLYVKAAATVASGSTTAFGTISYQM